MKFLFDMERCINASKNIYVQGHPDSSERKAQIEEAIARIQKDGKTAFESTYIGMKQYAGFGDQGVECKYGMGPTHGSVVFSIGRNDRHIILGVDEIYYLECVRDWKPFYTEPERNSYQKVRWSFDKTLREYVKIKTYYENLENKFKDFNPETNV